MTKRENINDDGPCRRAPKEFLRTSKIRTLTGLQLYHAILPASATYPQILLPNNLRGKWALNPQRLQLHNSGITKIYRLTILQFCLQICFSLTMWSDKSAPALHVWWQQLQDLVWNEADSFLEAYWACWNWDKGLHDQMLEQAVSGSGNRPLAENHSISWIEMSAYLCLHIPKLSGQIQNPEHQNNQSCVQERNSAYGDPQIWIILCLQVKVYIVPHLLPGPRSTRVPGATTCTPLSWLTSTLVRGAFTIVPFCLLVVTRVPGAMTVVPDCAFDTTLVPGAVTTASSSLRTLHASQQNCSSLLQGHVLKMKMFAACLLKHWLKRCS